MVHLKKIKLIFISLFSFFLCVPRFNLSTSVNSLSQIQSRSEVLGLGLQHMNFVGDTNQSRTSVLYSHFTDEEFDLESSKARKRVRCEVTIPLGLSDSRSSYLIPCGASLVAQMVKMQCRRSRFNHWVGKIPWRKKWKPTPVFLDREFHGQRSLAGYSPWGHKESDMTERLTLPNSLQLRPYTISYPIPHHP